MDKKDKTVSDLKSKKTGQKTAQETEDQMKNPRHWYEFYGEKLHEFWKEKKGDRRTQEALYKLIRKIMSEEESADKAASTIKDKFVRGKTITAEMIPAVSLLLLETDFYSQFFDIVMTHRLDRQNTEQESRKSYRLLKMVIAEKTDFVWVKWVDLFYKRYMESGDFRQKEKFFIKEIDRTDSQGIKSLLGRLKKFAPDIYEKIQFRKTVIDKFYKLYVIFHYRSMLHSRLFEAAEETERKRTEEAIKKCLDEGDLLFEEMQKISNLPEFCEFFEDFRISQNYHTGSCMLGTTVFKKLSTEEQAKELERKAECMKRMEPGEGDTLTYSIWYDYYNFHYIQNRMDYLLSTGSLEKGLDECSSCIQLLKTLDGKLKGGFLRLSLKIKYNLRILYLIYYSVEAMIQERSVGLSIDGTEYEKEILSEKRDKTVTEVLGWLQKLKKKPKTKFS